MTVSMVIFVPRVKLVYGWRSGTIRRACRTLQPIFFLTRDWPTFSYLQMNWKQKNERGYEKVEGEN